MEPTGSFERFMLPVVEEAFGVLARLVEPVISAMRERSADGSALRHGLT